MAVGVGTASGRLIRVALQNLGTTGILVTFLPGERECPSSTSVEQRRLNQIGSIAMCIEPEEGANLRLESLIMMG